MRKLRRLPPKEAGPPRPLFPRGRGLSFDPPSTGAGVDSFVSNPARPVPYRPRPVERPYSPTSRWRRWAAEDARFVDGRPAVLPWQTGPLAADGPRPGRGLAARDAAA